MINELCERVRQRIECNTCHYPACEARYLLTKENDPGCYYELNNIKPENPYDTDKKRSPLGDGRSLQASADA